MKKITVRYRVKGNDAIFTRVVEKLETRLVFGEGMFLEFVEAESGALRVGSRIKFDSVDAIEVVPGDTTRGEWKPFESASGARRFRERGQ